MFSDDILLEKLVLKGGNALDLVHNVGGRTSMDIDLSIDGEDFANLKDFRDRIFKTLKLRFDSEGFVIFDEKFEEKPNIAKPGQNPKWGGYEVLFKLITKNDFKKFNDNLDDIRRNASRIWFQEQRNFRIEISRHEYCVPKQSVLLDEFTIFVYTLPMIAVEKMRAICQQLPEYKLRKNPAPRARDFYDLHAIITQAKVDLFSPETLDLFDHIFTAKDVPIALLMKIRTSCEFHRADWPSVVGTTPRLNPPDFDFYFNFVVDRAEKLYAAWIK